MGRPRKSDAVKAAQGTLQKCRTEKAARSKNFRANGELLPSAPPPGLRAAAKDAWAAALIYAPKGLIQVTDAALLERWARDIALYRKYQRKLEDEGVLVTAYNKNGDEIQVINPLFKVVESLKKALSECEKNLGFSPSARARVSAAIPEESPPDEFNGF